MWSIEIDLRDSYGVQYWSTSRQYPPAFKFLSAAQRAKSLFLNIYKRETWHSHDAKFCSSHLESALKTQTWEVCNKSIVQVQNKTVVRVANNYGLIMDLGQYLHQCISLHQYASSCTIPCCPFIDHMFYVLEGQPEASKRHFHYSKKRCLPQEFCEEVRHSLRTPFRQDRRPLAMFGGYRSVLHQEFRTHCESNLQIPNPQVNRTNWWSAFNRWSKQNRKWTRAGVLQPFSIQSPLDFEIFCSLASPASTCAESEGTPEC